MKHLSILAASIVIAFGLPNAAVAEVHELQTEQARQMVELDYAEAEAAIAATSPDCDGPFIALAVECLAVIMDGPQGGTLANDDRAFANVPATPILKLDYTGRKVHLFVELNTETGSLTAIDAFAPAVQAQLRRDLFQSRRVVDRVRYELSETEQRTLLVEQKAITFEITEGWQRLALLEVLRAQITVNPPSVTFASALGAVDDWLP